MPILSSLILQSFLPASLNPAISLQTQHKHPLFLMDGVGVFFKLRPQSDQGVAALISMRPGEKWRRFLHRRWQIYFMVSEKKERIVYELFNTASYELALSRAFC